MLGPISIRPVPPSRAREKLSKQHPRNVKQLFKYAMKIILHLKRQGLHSYNLSALTLALV